MRITFPTVCLSSIVLYVSFVKEPYKRDPILQKRPVILRTTPKVYHLLLCTLCMLREVGFLTLLLKMIGLFCKRAL